MQKTTYSVFILITVLFLSVGFANQSLLLRAGDLVELNRDETLYFEATQYRKASKGDTYAVAAHRAEIQRLYVYSADKNGNTIALNLSDAAATPLQGPAKLRKLADIVRAGRFQEAQKLTERLSGGDVQSSLIPSLNAALKDMISALEEHEKLSKGRPVIENRVSEYNKKIGQILGPKLLDTNASQRDVERADRLRKEAFSLQQEFDNLWLKKENALGAARQSLDVLLEKIDQQPQDVSIQKVEPQAKILGVQQVEPQAKILSVQQVEPHSQSPIWSPNSTYITLGVSIVLFLSSVFIFFRSRRRD